MKYIKTNPELVITNRERLRNLLVPGALVVVNSNDIMPTNADGTMGNQQNSDLYYLTGINQEETVLLLCPDHPNPAFREILFLRETNELLTIWEGHKYTMEEAAAISGIGNVRWLSDFGPIFRQLMCEQEDVYLNTNEHYRAANVVQTRDMRFVEQCRKDYPLHSYHRLARLMHQLRVIKSPIEVELIKKACDITGMGFARVLKNVRPGINEAEIESSDLKVLRFSKDNLDPWFDFVMANRHTKAFTHDYDLVIGPVANDKVFVTLTLFEQGIIDKFMAIQQLKTFVLWDQYLFHTAKALKYLRFDGTEE